MRWAWSAVFSSMDHFSRCRRRYVSTNATRIWEVRNPEGILFINVWNAAHFLHFLLESRRLLKPRFFEHWKTSNLDKSELRVATVIDPAFHRQTRGRISCVWSKIWLVRFLSSFVGIYLSLASFMPVVNAMFITVTFHQLTCLFYLNETPESRCPMFGCQCGCHQAIMMMDSQLECHLRWGIEASVTFADFELVWAVRSVRKLKVILLDTISQYLTRNYRWCLLIYKRVYEHKCRIVQYMCIAKIIETKWFHSCAFNLIRINWE